MAGFDVDYFLMAIEVGMEEHCMVICGEWRCSVDGNWDFVIDKNRMSRLVAIKLGIKLTELEEVVMGEFGESIGSVAVLSYWPSHCMELATGLRTPPVLLTSDGGIGYFLKHLCVNNAMNLFVKFERLCKTSKSSVVGEDVCGYTTLVAERKRRVVFGKSSNSGKSVFEDGFVNWSTAGSKAHPMEAEDEELIRYAESVEASLGVGRDETHDTESVWSEENVESDTDGGVEEDINGIEIRPQGYDTEFWMPLLRDDFASSNAAEVIIGADVYGGKIDASVREVRCSLNDVFDHPVLVNDDGVSGSNPKMLGEEKMPAWMCTGGYSDVNETTRAGPCGWINIDKQFVRPVAEKSRLLSEVDDEEFDIPPLYDDTECEWSEIPDLDIDEVDDRVFVGRVYGSKVDCQIALAIYAIKKLILFKQTRTKVEYLVLSCADERCDWRIMAKEQNNTGYYEIKREKLDHV